MERNRELRPGDKIKVVWGHYGVIEASVHRIGSRGQIYARRWRKNFRNWTQPRQVFPFSQEGETLYTLEKQESAEEQPA